MSRRMRYLRNKNGWFLLLHVRPCLLLIFVFNNTVLIYSQIKISDFSCQNNGILWGNAKFKIRIGAPTVSGFKCGWKWIRISIFLHSPDKWKRNWSSSKFFPHTSFKFLKISITLSQQLLWVFIASLMNSIDA